MVRKLKELVGEANEDSGAADKNLASTVRDSAQQIWLAGLGAFSKAQAEGGKVFEALVKEGKGLEALTRNFAGARVSKVSQNFSKATEEATKTATQTWDKLEQVFESRVERSLGRLGVPSKKEIDALSQRVDALTESVQKLASAAKPTAKRAAKKASPRTMK
jgi:poly(hydroxyalkanoate) granule-associated protein